MSTKPYVKLVVRPLTMAKSVPPWMVTAVGRIVIASGWIEHNQLLIAKRLLGINIAKARIVFGNARWKEHAEKILVLAEMASFDTRQDLDDLASRLEKAQNRRNLLVHSPWLTDGSSLYVQQSRGGQKYRRAASPERFLVDRKFLNDSKLLVMNCLRDVRALAKETESLLNS